MHVLVSTEGERPVASEESRLFAKRLLLRKPSGCYLNRSVILSNVKQVKMRSDREKGGQRMRMPMLIS